MSAKRLSTAIRPTSHTSIDPMVASESARVRPLSGCRLSTETFESSARNPFLTSPARIAVTMRMTMTAKTFNSRSVQL